MGEKTTLVALDLTESAHSMILSKHGIQRFSLLDDLGPGIWLILPAYAERMHICEFLGVLQEFITSIGASPSSTSSIFERISTGGTSHASNEFYGIDTILFSPGIAKNWRLKDRFSMLVLQSLRGRFALRFLDRDVKTEEEWTIMYALYKLARGNIARGTSGDRMNAVMDLIIRPEDERYNKYFEDLHEINEDMNEKGCWTLWYDSSAGQQEEIPVGNGKDLKKEADVSIDNGRCLVPEAGKEGPGKDEEIAKEDHDAKQERDARNRYTKVDEDAKEDDYTEGYADDEDYPKDEDYADERGYSKEEEYAEEEYAEEEYVEEEEYPEEESCPGEEDYTEKQVYLGKEGYTEEDTHKGGKGDKEVTRANEEEHPREAVEELPREEEHPREEEQTAVEQHSKEDYDIRKEEKIAAIAVIPGGNDDIALNNQDEPRQEQTEDEQVEIGHSEKSQGEEELTEEHVEMGQSEEEVDKKRSEKGQTEEEQVEESPSDEEQIEMDHSDDEQTNKEEVDKERDEKGQSKESPSEEEQIKGQNRNEQNMEIQNGKFQNGTSHNGDQPKEFQNEEQSEQSQDEARNEEIGGLELESWEAAENDHDHNIWNWLYGWNNLGWPVAWWEDMITYG